MSWPRGIRVAFLFDFIAGPFPLFAAGSGTPGAGESLIADDTKRKLAAHGIFVPDEKRDADPGTSGSTGLSVSFEMELREEEPLLLDVVPTTAASAAQPQSISSTAAVAEEPGQEELLQSRTGTTVTVEAAAAPARDKDKKLVVEVGVNDASVYDEFKEQENVLVVGFEPVLDKYARVVTKYYSPDETGDDVVDTTTQTPTTSCAATTTALCISWKDLWSVPGKYLVFPFAVGDDTVTTVEEAAEEVVLEEGQEEVQGGPDLHLHFGSSTPHDKPQHRSEKHLLSIKKYLPFHIAKLDGCSSLSKIDSKKLDGLLPGTVPTQVFADAEEERKEKSSTARKEQQDLHKAFWTERCGKTLSTRIVPVVSLRTLLDSGVIGMLQSNRKNSIDFLKIDAQGYDVDVVGSILANTPQFDIVQRLLNMTHYSLDAMLIENEGRFMHRLLKLDATIQPHNELHSRMTSSVSGSGVVPSPQHHKLFHFSPRSQLLLQRAIKSIQLEMTADICNIPYQHAPLCSQALFIMNLLNYTTLGDNCGDLLWSREHSFCTTDFLFFQKKFSFNEIGLYADAVFKRRRLGLGVGDPYEEVVKGKLLADKAKMESKNKPDGSDANHVGDHSDSQHVVEKMNKSATVVTSPRSRTRLMTWKGRLQVLDQFPIRLREARAGTPDNVTTGQTTELTETKLVLNVECGLESALEEEEDSPTTSVDATSQELRRHPRTTTTTTVSFTTNWRRYLKFLAFPWEQEEKHWRKNFLAKHSEDMRKKLLDSPRFAYNRPSRVRNTTLGTLALSSYEEGEEVEDDHDGGSSEGAGGRTTSSGRRSTRNTTSAKKLSQHYVVPVDFVKILRDVFENDIEKFVKVFFEDGGSSGVVKEVVIRDCRKVSASQSGRIHIRETAEVDVRLKRIEQA
ncbi:unnamed protein product [Amoebophrya sp. A120]|nr:unnamed protein product [Amoebophrya sp. A120]|eukprot:GSA120T00013354001.1